MKFKEKVIDKERICLWLTQHEELFLIPTIALYRDKIDEYPKRLGFSGGIFFLFWSVSINF